NTLVGGAGNDTLNGGIGNDILVGGAGDDALTGGAGNDRLDGGAGDDALTGGAGNDLYYVDSGLDRVIEAGGGTDSVYARVDYALAAGQEVESLRANAGATGLTLTGNEFNNTLVGGAGNDTLNGGIGKDILVGGAGHDRLDGGAGDDALTGGADNDLFIFQPGFGMDTITDFVAGPASVDVIDFAASIFDDFASVLAAANQVGADTVITVDGGNVLTLKNVALANLHQDDFQFIAA
ncbi:calcium-binding protein, partial [Mesorhizobium sp.]|uniref:calcium-binding protein n=1 Tax=Mesorhizobium sp. TaxID=1871066 RepID=UPI0012155ABF